MPMNDSNANELTVSIANDLGGTQHHSDTKDLSYGLRFIPSEVTIARRHGDQVDFFQLCKNSCCWYWQFQDGSRTYYWERSDYERFGTEKCSLCGNKHLKGGHILAAQF